MELSIELDTHAVDRLFARAPQELTQAILFGLDDGSALVLREQQLYPPKRNSQTYVRTLTLKRSWHRRPPLKRGYTIIRAVVSSGQDAPYNVLVQKAGMQAVVHRGRWPTEVQVAERTRPYIVNMMRIRIDRAAALLSR